VAQRVVNLFEPIQIKIKQLSSMTVTFAYWPTLLIDLDPAQPSLSSYYQLVEEAQGGIYDLLAFNITESLRIISSTAIPNLSLVISNDINNQLNSLLLQAPDGRLRLANLMPAFKDHFDLVLIDTQGARSAMLEMVVLASDLVISPLLPNMLAAREFSRGTMQMLDGLRAYERLGMKIPPVHIVINNLDLTVDAQMIEQSVREISRTATTSAFWIARSLPLSSSAMPHPWGCTESFWVVHALGASTPPPSCCAAISCLKWACQRTSSRSSIPFRSCCPTDPSYPLKQLPGLAWVALFRSAHQAPQRMSLQTFTLPQSLQLSVLSSQPKPSLRS
jgi:cellulose biosynthesis protein BcsQ